MMTKIRRILLGAIWMGVASAAVAQHEGATRMRAATPEQLRADLDELKLKAPRIHFKLFHDLKQEEFEAQIEELKRRVPSMTQEQWALEVTQLIAAVKDGHTSVMPLALVPRDGRVLPFDFYEFDDGVFIVGADAAY